MGLRNWVTRLLSGEVHYSKIGSMNPLWSDLSDKIDTAKTNPILLPAIQLIADYFSSARFYEVDGKNEKSNTKLISLLANPNPYQTGDDFLKQHVWYKYSCGFCYTYPVENVLYDDKLKGLTHLYNLKPDKIEFDKDFKTNLIFTESQLKSMQSQKIIYNREKDKREIPIGSIIPFYDLANGLDDNMLTAPSRLDALKHPLSNIERAFEAKNIIIQSNGKEMITNETIGNIAKIPIRANERKIIDKVLAEDYGLGKNKKRTIVTNSALKYQSLHIILKELGLDESAVADAMTIINAFNIPPELFQVNGKSATFENQEKAVIHFLQSKIQRELNDFCNTLNNRYGTTLIAKLDHLPIMQSINKSRIATLRSFAFGLKMLVEATILTVPEAKEQYYKYIDQI